eukprot:gene16907-18613_t
MLDGEFKATGILSRAVSSLLLCKNDVARLMRMEFSEQIPSLHVEDDRSRDKNSHKGASKLLLTTVASLTFIITVLHNLVHCDAALAVKSKTDHHYHANKSYHIYLLAHAIIQFAFVHVVLHCQKPRSSFLKWYMNDDKQGRLWHSHSTSNALPIPEERDNKVVNLLDVFGSACSDGLCLCRKLHVQLFVVFSIPAVIAWGNQLLPKQTHGVITSLLVSASAMQLVIFCKDKLLTSTSTMASGSMVLALVYGLYLILLKSILSKNSTLQLMYVIAFVEILLHLMLVVLSRNSLAAESNTGILASSWKLFKLIVFSFFKTVFTLLLLKISDPLTYLVTMNLSLIPYTLIKRSEAIVRARLSVNIKTKMADKIVLRCSFQGGQRKVVNGLTKDSTASQLQEELFILTGVAPHRQRILFGFPPKELAIDDGDKLITSMLIRSGDTLIVEENKSAPKVQQYQADVPKLVLRRHVVPADNSCLFASLSFLFFGGDKSLAPEMRKLAAQCISSDPETFNVAVLEKTNEEYCKWIMQSDHWGGGIEITALAKYYQTEIDVVDIQSGRIDRFGQDGNYKNRVFLIYDGIHYDPLSKEEVDKPGQPIQTTFASSDESVYAEALSLSKEAKQKRQFTDLNGFTLRCLACQTTLTGQKDAQSHAMATGHTNFGEL